MSNAFIIRPALVLLLFFTAQLTNAQVYTAKSYKLTIEGTSTMHNWSSSATGITVTGDFVIANGVIEKINSGSVNVVTTSIKSHKNSGLMDSRTHETLKADKYPNIIYTVTKVGNIQKNGNEATVTINGSLNIGGAAKPTDLVLKMKVLPNGDIEITGNKKITMSTYNIKPPSFMLGALKVGDEVTLNIYTVLTKK